MMKIPRRPLPAAWIFSSAAVLATAAAVWLFTHPDTGTALNLSFYADRGELLLHAVRSRAVSYSMPLLSLLWAARQHLNIAPSLPGSAACLLTALTAFGLGARGGGPARGAVYALAALLAALTSGTRDTEQEIYSLALLIFLNLELLRQTGKTFLLAGASGAAAAITMLIRSPLCLFPPLTAAYGYFTGGTRLKKWLPGAAVFLLFAFVPLVPWARLNHSLFGRTILFEEGRPESNLITGAMGMTFTIEGDARALAGLSRQDSALRWAAARVAAAPGRYAAAVVRRAWNVFLMSPWLFLLAGLGFLFNHRSRETRFLAFFCGYFIFIHCLLSIEERYFYPLRYVLALIAAGGAWELAKKAGLAAEEKGRDLFTLPLFAAAAALAALALGAVWRYPAAARHPLIAATEELKTHPGESWLLRKRGETLLSFNLTAEGRADLALACAARRDAGPCYIPAALAGEPGPLPPGQDRYELLLVKTLRELELDRTAAARGTFKEAMGIWLDERNLVRGGGKENGERRRIIKLNQALWDTDLPGALLYFPPAVRRTLLARMSAIPEFSPGLAKLKTSPAFSENGAMGYDDASALLAAALEILGPAAPPPPGIPPAARALALALGTAGGNGTLAQLLLNCGPSFGGVAALYLDLKRNGAAAAALEKRTNPDGGCFYPALRLLALKNGPEAGKAALALETAAAKSPSFTLEAARILNGSGARAEAKLLAGFAERSSITGREELKDLALLYQDLRDYPKSLAITASLLKKDPSSPELNNNLGVLLLFLKRDGEAETALAKAAGERNASFSAQLNLAALYARRGDRERSAVYYRKALENPALPPGEKTAVKEILTKLF